MAQSEDPMFLPADHTTCLIYRGPQRDQCDRTVLHNPQNRLGAYGARSRAGQKRGIDISFLAVLVRKSDDMMPSSIRITIRSVSRHERRFLAVWMCDYCVNKVAWIHGDHDDTLNSSKDAHMNVLANTV